MPSSNVIVLPDPPEVVLLLDPLLVAGELLLAGEALFFFLTVRATDMAITAAIKTKADRAMGKISFLRDDLTFGAWRVR